MAGTRKNFLNYDAARVIVIALGLTSMQDWIAYAKGKDAQGRIRPSDIPSNPWTVYKDELAAKGLKFKINDFIGCKLPRKPRTKKADGEVKPKRVKKTQADAPVADVPEAPEVILTPFEMAKNAIQAFNLKNREAFYEMKRNDMLPVGVPRKPEETFKNSGWAGWGDFLGNGNKQAGTESTSATA